MAAEFPPLAALPKLTLHESINRDKVDASKIVDDWLSSLAQRFTQNRLTDLSDLFIEESWWRDLVALSWDFTSKHGPKAISKYLGASTAGFGQLNAIQPGALQPQLVDMGGMMFIQSGFSFQTKVGSGRGLIRLANVGPEEWKGWTVLTQLERLTGQDKLEKQRLRESETQTGVSDVANGYFKPKTEDLQVLVIGAGQSGLAIAAHLQNLGLRYLVVDKAPRLGDSWWARYETIKSHTPIYSDHYPFLKFPTNWPRWLDQEHIANWIEHYGRIMGLNIIHNTTVGKIEYNESTRQYSVEIENKEAKQVLRPKHVVLATGVFSHVPIRPQFPGEDSFGGNIYHSSKHKSAAQIPDLQNKKVTIVGCGTSAHDIAQDFVNRGAKGVSIVQRHPIFSVSTDSIEKFQVILWNTPGLSTEDADLLGNSFPTALARTMGIGMSQMMTANDKTLLDGLEKAGLALRKGDEGNSILDHVLIKAGHFYIDQGASQMIVDGRIKIHRCEQGVKELYPQGVILGNGDKVEADVVVLATGYERNKLTVEQMMGKEVAQKVGNFGFLDDEQERIGWWRPTHVPGFWFMTGSFLWCRQFSPLLALQISAVEQGLNDQYYKA